MIMFITLTNSMTSRKTIINWGQVHSCYELIDKNINSMVTKINFSKDSYIIVSERLEEIHELLTNAKYGMTQDVVWDKDVSLDDRVEESYREKNYNRF
jgi:hypothetical protein